MHDAIPFNRPCLAGREMELMQEAITSGHSSCGGPFSRQAADRLSSILTSPHVLLTTSCTDALEMAAMLLDVGPGDVVIVPSFTFTSTALAFARQGATLRFADIDPDTLGLDPHDVARLVDDRLKAIVTVHYAGVPSDVEALLHIAGDAGADLVEDNAHGLFATHHGKPLGSFGRFSTLSFHETKNFICGEGGALAINDEQDVDRAHVLLDKGTNRRQFLDGLADKYTWQDLGSSFGLSDVLAAFLLGQLEQADTIRRKRRCVSETYRTLLEPHVEELGIGLPKAPPTAEPADHMFYVMMTNESERSAAIADMRTKGVHATFHYVPLHSSPAGRRSTDVDNPCPVTDDVSRRLLRLPFYNDLAEAQIERVVDVFLATVRRTRMRN